VCGMGVLRCVEISILRSSGKWRGGAVVRSACGGRKVDGAAGGVVSKDGRGVVWCEMVWNGIGFAHFLALHCPRGLGVFD
jgi:hypothetical protein